jgi:hypothetical protein
MTQTPRPDQTRTESFETETAVAEVIAFLADPTRIPDWAPAFADSICPVEDSRWQATKDSQRFSLRVVTNPEAGTVDYLREVAPGREGGAYLRAIPGPRRGSVIVMTVPVPANVDAAQTAATLTRELAGLALLVEQWKASSGL